MSQTRPEPGCGAGCLRQVSACAARSWRRLAATGATLAVVLGSASRGGSLSPQLLASGAAQALRAALGC